MLEAVTGSRRWGRPARLPDHARYRVRGRVHPAAVAQAGATTNGVLYEGIDEAEWAVLDRFEGDLYERALREVFPEAGGVRLAHVYLLDRGREHALSPEAWSLEAFEERHLQRYLALCRAFRASLARAGTRGEERR